MLSRQLGENGNRLEQLNHMSSHHALLQTACDTPKQWGALQELLAQVEQGLQSHTINHLIEQVDQSDFSLTDWINALLSFDQWLSKHNSHLRPVDNMISYIHCCTLTLSDSLAPPDLAKLTNKMLSQYGFDAASDIDTT